MDYMRITPRDFPELSALHSAYKAEIGEDAPGAKELERLRQAVAENEILFYGCRADGRLVACCSVSRVFSTFQYGPSGVFEDFYIVPDYRHRGIARSLARYAFEQSGVGAMTVGCAECDLPMYRAIGFTIPLGHMLAYSADEEQ